MEEQCGDCSSVEQSIYWNHFQTMHFCQIMDSQSRSHLVIPRKFSENTKEKLQEKVTLMGPSGATTWEVNLVRDEDNLFLGGGWTDFVNAYSLQENDILIFKYDGNSCFSVMIFDKGTLCERESSYFVKKCDHSRPNQRIQEKRCLQASPEEFTQEYSHEESDMTPQTIHKKAIDGDSPVVSQQHIVYSFSDMSDLEASRCVDTGAAKESLRNLEKSWTWEPVKLPPVPRKLISPKKDQSTSSVMYVSQRRPVTEEQKEAALEMAKKELTPDSFLIVMRPSHVYRKFFLTIPAHWIGKYLNFKNQNVQLQTGGSTWSTTLTCRSARSAQRGGLSVGWKAFSLDNCLEEHDVCLFKHTSQKLEPVVLDVTIFRVAQEVVRKTRLSPSLKK